MVIDLPDGYQQGANPIEYYDFHRTVHVADNSWAARDTVNVDLAVGILRRIIVYFPPGCLSYVRSNIYHGLTQIFPTDPVGAGAGTYYIAGDDDWIETRDSFFCYLPTGSIQLTLNSWNTGAVTGGVYCNHTIDYYFAVERVVVP